MIAKVFSFPKLISVLCCDCWFTNCGQFRKATKNWRKIREKIGENQAKIFFLNFGAQKYILALSFTPQKILKNKKKFWPKNQF